jgi:hypothetical protein
LNAVFPVESVQLENATVSGNLFVGEIKGVLGLDRLIKNFFFKAGRVLNTNFDYRRR